MPLPAAYLKTLAGTNIPDGKFALLMMAIYCNEDRLIRKRHANLKFMAGRTQVSECTALRHIQGLEAQGLIKSVKKRRVMHWQLPSEEELMQYTPPKKKARKKRTNLFQKREAKVQAPVPAK